MKKKFIRRVMARHLCVFGFSLLGLCISMETAYAQTTVTSVVNAATDDQEEYVSNGALDIASSDIELVTDAGDQIIGLRFRAVNIPAGAVITHAYLQFTADEANTGTTTLNIKGESTDSSGTFAQTSFAVSTRLKTSSSVSWNVNPWPTIQAQGADQRSPDIRSVIQEIINRSGWKPNNALSVIISGSGKRVAESFEGATAGTAGHAASQAPTLIVEYIMPVTISSVVNADTDDQEEYVSNGVLDIGSSDLEMVNEGGGDQLIGLRFKNINIPKGSVITSAYLQFTADEAHTAAAVLNIKGEATDSANTFGQTSFAVSTRPKTTAAVSWNVNPWPTIQAQGSDQRSSDIKSVIQEIVSRQGWKANNAIAVIITGTGKRVAEAYEGAIAGTAGHAASQAPTLIISYEAPVSLTTVVNAASDDQEEYVSNGVLDIGSTDLEMVNEGGGDQIIGLRFNNLNIPQGASISSAYLQFTADEATTGATTLNIKGEAVDSSSTFTANNFTVSSRPKTSAGVSWNVNSWPTLQVQGADQRSADIKNVIQEIIARQGWKANNSLALIVSGSGKRVAEAYEGATAGTAGHAASQAANLIINYTLSPAGSVATPPPAPGKFPVPVTSIWRYQDSGTYPGATWKDSSFNDSAWAFGLAELGYGDGGEATEVKYGPNPGNKYITTYFRHTFNVTDKSLVDSLVLSLMRDDGAVVYLNGNEIVRSNMPSGAVNFMTRASSTVGGTDESRYYTFTVSPQFLVNGRNVIAAEVHQDSIGSSDISFNLGLIGKRNDLRLASSGQPWKYIDNGNLPGSSWFSESFNDSLWKSGASPLGYGNGNEATTVGFGSNAASKHITTYFRKKFSVTDTALFGALVLSLKRDDGAVVYLNGAELLRNNMPSGPVANSTLAATFIEGPEEETWLEYTISKTQLKIGSNQLAVEIHQNSATSTDIKFDLELKLQQVFKPLSSLANNVTCNPSSSDKIGCFTSILPTPQQPSFVYPKSTHTFQSIAKAGKSVYSGTSTTLAGGFDFTGYVPANGSSTNGYLALNHENTPGGVSMFELHYNETTKLWVVDSIKKVDFSGVVHTIRNCSGGITPWGTAITSEESYNTGDANGDGYQDAGWQTEIDPATGKVMDYNNDGNPDKLWAMGRMSHENIAISQDSMTIYQTEDGGTGGVYKYVAFQKMRLDSGLLFVLKRDAPGATTGTWVQVPNPTKAQRNTVSTAAGSLGTNWGGCEDIEFGPDGMMYFAEKGSGNIWRFKDSVTKVTRIEAYVSNVSYPIVYDGGTTTEPFNTGVDNLAFDGEGNLWALQDGGRDHIWMIRNGHTPANPKVELFATSPAGSEPTGITFSPDYRFMFLSFQNASGSNSVVQKDAADSSVVMNSSTTVVIARKEYLGAGAISPLVELGSDISVCAGTPVKLKYFNKDAQHVWSDNSTDSILNITQSGKYSITVTGNNGKVAKDSINVTVTPAPVVNLGADKEICKGSSAILNAGAGLASYLWDNGTISDTRTANSTGTYFVKVTNAQGCFNSDTIKVKVNQLPDVSLGIDKSICQGSTVALSPGTAFVSYLWNNNSALSSLNVTSAGLYSVKATDSKGCINSDTVNVKVNPLPVVNLGKDTSICSGCVIMLNAGAGFTNYLWSTGNFGSSISVNTAGNYSVTVKDANNCEGSDDVNVTIATTGIESESFTGVKLMVFPNPFSGEVNVSIDMQESGKLYIGIYDVTGREVAILSNSENKAGSYTYLFDSAELLAPGIYVLKVSVNGITKDYKLIKQ